MAAAAGALRAGYCCTALWESSDTNCAKSGPFSQNISNAKQVPVTSGRRGFSPAGLTLDPAKKELRGKMCRKPIMAVAVRDAVAINIEKASEVKSSNGFATQNVFNFVKYHGLGNDFLLVDNRGSENPFITPEQAIRLCDRNFGVGGDGVIFVLPGIDGSDYSMRIYNSDGSEPEMCGNGIRCMAKFIAELEGRDEPRSYSINTLGGVMVPKVLDDGQVCVDMGPPTLEAAKIPTTLLPSQDGAVVKVPLVVDGTVWKVTCVSMGNPHCVTILDDGKDVSQLPLSSIGPLFEHHEVFPSRTNTEFVQVLTSSRLRMRVWERGAGATLACGTGACALLVAAVLEGRAERICTVELPGGPLEIEWREDDNHLYMTGQAEKVFVGSAFL